MFHKDLKSFLKSITYCYIVELALCFHKILLKLYEIISYECLLKYGFFKKLIHYECTFCQLTIDGWKLSTGKRCIRNEVTSLKIHTLMVSKKTGAYECSFRKYFAHYVSLFAFCKVERLQYFKLVSSLLFRDI